MAAKSFEFRLITPQGKLLDSVVSSVAIPAHDGSMGQLPNHAAFVVKLGLGELRINFAPDPRAAPGSNQGGSRAYLVEDGFAQMVDNRLTVLTTRAIPVEQLTESDAQAELNKAEAAKPENTSLSAATALRRDRDRARLKLRLALARARAGKGI